MKSERELISYFEVKKKKTFDPIAGDLSDFVMEQFSNWLNGYTKAFNKKYKRKGGLFIDYLKRSEASDEGSLTSFIFYVHKNAVHHGLTNRIGEWAYDSYKAFIINKETALKRNEVLEWFGSRQHFIDFHSQPVYLKEIDFTEL